MYADVLVCWQVQTIGFLSHLRSRGVPGPHMIIGPLSTLSNWVAEFERWCPTIPVILYHGSRAERQKLRTSRMPTGAPLLSVGCSSMLCCSPCPSYHVLLTSIMDIHRCMASALFKILPGAAW